MSTRRAVLPLIGAVAGLSALPLGRHARAVQTKAPAAPASPVLVSVIADGLVHPWGLQVLPDADLLITERPGRLRIVSMNGKRSEPVGGVPTVWANGQGGLLDVALAPDFSVSGRIVFAYAESRSGGGGTAVATARLLRGGGQHRLEGVAVIFRQLPSRAGGLHFGCRLAFGRDARLFVTLGDRGHKDGAQDLAGHLGKVVRINGDGTIPGDNPFVGQPGKLAEIWSYGHRNPQAAAIHPMTGKLWAVEHGPRGGDEINIPSSGRNYGWPVIGYGIDYSGARIHEAASRDGMEQPVYYWRPSIAPSGMAFYTGDLFPAWRGNLFVGALAGQALHRLVLSGEEIVSEEIMLTNLRERIRDVRQGPDGSLLLLTDEADGKVLQILPARR